MEKMVISLSKYQDYYAKASYCYQSTKTKYELLTTYFFLRHAKSFTNDFILRNVASYHLLQNMAPSGQPYHTPPTYTLIESPNLFCGTYKSGGIFYFHGLAYQTF